MILKRPIFQRNPPTISKLNIRTALCISAMKDNGTAYVPDITQAYTQNKSELPRPVFLEPISEFNLPKWHMLQAFKPLHGIPEAGLHCFLTYSTHHKEKLKISSTTMDKFLLYRMYKSSPVPDITALQVEDSFGCGSNSFLNGGERK